MSYEPAPSTAHFFTVDVEDYFQVSAFDELVPRSTWDSLPSRVVANVDKLLDLLASYGVTGTFFTLGWVAQRHPQVVRAIVAAGHEVASHGFWHQRVITMDASQFRQDVRAAKRELEDISGQEVVGYRAPSFSIVPGLEWAFDVLLEEGYRYDSSLFPVKRRGYGYPDAPPIPHLIERPSGQLCEFPLATTKWNGVRIPAAGGGYLRHFPFAVIRRAFEEHGEAGMPAVFYIHPWEIDSTQPRLPASLLTRVRHYRNLDRTMPRLHELLRSFRFTSIASRAVETTPALSQGASLKPALAQ